MENDENVDENEVENEDKNEDLNVDEKKSAYGWTEVLGIIIYLIQEKVSPLKHSKKALIAVYVTVALGFSILAGGAITYLATYGSESAYAASPGDASLSAVPIEVAPTSSLIVVATPTFVLVPTPFDVMSNPPGGTWTSESCQEKGREMNAVMTSFWTSPQGVGCNILTADGTWMTLR